MKINFYHLTASPIEKALPKLLEKAVLSGAKTLLVAENENRVEELNKFLWTYTTKFFLPHGSKEDGYAEQQPIYLTSANDNPNNATILAFVEMAEPANINGFEKCLYMFDGNNESQLNFARKRWKKYKEEGHELTYWQQNPKGGWEEAA